MMFKWDYIGKIKVFFSFLQKLSHVNQPLTHDNNNNNNYNSKRNSNNIDWVNNNNSLMIMKNSVMITTLNELENQQGARLNRKITIKF